MKKTLILKLLLMTFAVGCENTFENDFNKPDEDLNLLASSVNMLKFNDSEELIKSYKNTLGFSVSERLEWEKEFGFSSLGTMSDLLYMSIDFTEFDSQDELLEYINEHSDFLQIIKDKNGEIILESIVHENPFRYFANKDGVFQVGDDIFKVLPNHTIKTRLEHLELLKSYKESDINSLIETGGVVIFKTQLINDHIKDSQYNCGSNWVDDRADNGRNRTYIRIANEYLALGLGELNTTYVVRPYIRTLGVWYWCSRTVSCDLKVATAWLDINTNSWEREIGSYSNSGTGTTVLSGILNTVLGISSSAPFHFDGYNCWGKTPDTPKAELICNPALLSESFRVFLN